MRNFIERLLILRPALAEHMHNHRSFDACVDSDGVPQICAWPSTVPAVTMSEVEAVTDAQLEAHFSAKAAAVVDEQNRVVWLKTVREKYQALQDDLATARTAFLSLKAKHDALESWARTKGYTG